MLDGGIADHRMARERRPCADDRARRRCAFSGEVDLDGLCRVTEVVTFGCRLNAYESEAIQRARRRGAAATTPWWSTPAP